MSPSPARITPPPIHSVNGFMGIDPGKSGGIVIMYPSENGIHPFDAFIMPPTEFELWVLMTRLKAVCGNGTIHCCMERVHSMPNEGHKGTFTFGEGFGRLKMALTAAAIPYELVEPQRWQKEFSIKPRQKKEPKALLKERCRAMAQQLFPRSLLWEGTLGSQRAVCDAILLAEYCRRYNTLQLRK